MDIATVCGNGPSQKRLFPFADPLQLCFVGFALHCPPERELHFVLADFQSYIDCQKEVSQAWADQHRWTKMSILNATRMGEFSSDRTIRDYSRDIWRVEPNPVQLADIG